MVGEERGPRGCGVLERCGFLRGFDLRLLCGEHPSLDPSLLFAELAFAAGLSLGEGVELSEHPGEVSEPVPLVRVVEGSDSRGRQRLVELSAQRFEGVAVRRHVEPLEDIAELSNVSAAKECTWGRWGAGGVQPVVSGDSPGELL